MLDSVTSRQRIEIIPEFIATINPYLHGHFSEHLGELVYPGIWVPLNSPIPNENGIRRDVVEALRPLHIPVLRWPGGCFADDYHWRDGIGPLDQRPLRINRHWGMEPEPNQFGTHEFIEFCRALGAEPYFAGNLGSGSPSELRNWVEYCNFAGSSTLANERRANGAEEPFGVRFWGIGNENWGCGGDMSPERYAEEFCRFRSFVSSYSGTRVQAIACGQNNADWGWTRRFFRHMKSNYWDRLGGVQGFAAHYYCGAAGTATEYSREQWFELLARAYAVDGIITGCRALMDEYDPTRKIALLLDEWGAWHPVEKGKPRGGLYQQNSIRDACVAALSLDVFHNHADKLFMCNIAQLINVLQAVLLVEENRCIKTPTYHVFDLYRPHQGAKAMRFESYGDTASTGEGSADHCRTRYLAPKPFRLRTVEGSASLNEKDGRVCITLVNTMPDGVCPVEVLLYRSQLESVEMVQLSADEYHAHNTFTDPDRVRLSQPVEVRPRDGVLEIDMPPASVVRLQGNLVQ